MAGVLLNSPKTRRSLRPQQAPFPTAGTTNPLLGRSATAWTILRRGRRPLRRMRPRSRNSVIPAPIPVALIKRETMPRRPAHITQADVARVIRAAKQEGVREIEVRVGAASIVMRISPSTDADETLEQGKEIVL